MKLTSGKRPMYQVMKAISDSGIPTRFKGAMVLRAWLDEHGYADDTRHTMDIDADWLTSEPPTAELMCQSIQSALDQTQIALSVNLKRMHGIGRSAGLNSGFRRPMKYSSQWIWISTIRYPKLNCTLLRTFPFSGLLFGK